jgi:hypothetical protein
MSSSELHSRYIQHAREKRLNHKVKVMKLRSRILHMQAELGHSDQQLLQERERIKSINASLANLRHCQYSPSNFPEIVASSQRP